MPNAAIETLRDVGWVPRRIPGSLYGPKVNAEIVRSCGRCVGHTLTMLRGAAQVADLTVGPVDLVFGRHHSAECYVHTFAEIATKMGYEDVVVTKDAVIVNGTKFYFIGLEEQHRPSPVRYYDKSCKRETPEC